MRFVDHVADRQCQRTSLRAASPLRNKKILMETMQHSRTKDAAAVAAATIHVMAALRYFLDDHGSANGTSTTKLQPSSPNAERNVIFLS